MQDYHPERQLPGEQRSDAGIAGQSDRQDKSVICPIAMTWWHDTQWLFQIVQLHKHSQCYVDDSQTEL